MLIAQVTPRAGGYKLSGDYLDLRSLHRSLHEICDDESDEDAFPENLIYQLAYDVRKATDGRREKTKVESFDDRRVFYRSAILSFPRSVIQFAFLLRLIRSKPLPLQRTADYHAFGATVGSALEQIGMHSPEKFIVEVSQSIDAWPTWPDAYLVDVIDLEFLCESRTRPKRISALKKLPDNLRHDGSYARTKFQKRNEYAASQGVAPESLGPVWPDEPPKY